jgi:hypothetical protein
MIKIVINVHYKLNYLIKKSSNFSFVLNFNDNNNSKNYSFN